MHTHTCKSVEIYILKHLSVNNNIIFSFANFALSPFSVGVVFLPLHGKILDEILDELLTRRYKLNLLTLHNSPSCPAGSSFAYRFPNLQHPPLPLNEITCPPARPVSVHSASSRTTLPPFSPLVFPPDCGAHTLTLHYLLSSQPTDTATNLWWQMKH